MRLKAVMGVAVFAGAALVLAGCSGDTGGGDGGGGDTGSDPEELNLVLTPSVEADVLATGGEELAEMLTDEIGIQVNYFSVTDYNGAATAFETGQAQIGMLAPALEVSAIDRAGAVPILTVERYGGTTYVTQWFTNDPDTYCLDEVVTNDEGMTFCNGTDAEEISGPAGEDALELITPDTSLAFVDATSSSGYYFPVTQLIDLGVVESPDDLTGTFFAGGHPEAVMSVARGEATVGVSFNDARENVLEEIPTVGEDVTVFAWSPNIPNDGVVVSGDLSEELQQKISDAFVTISESEEGLALLDDLYTVDALVPADPDALDIVRQVVENFPDE